VECEAADAFRCLRMFFVLFSGGRGTKSDSNCCLVSVVVCGSIQTFDVCVAPLSAAHGVCIAFSYKYCYGCHICVYMFVSSYWHI